MVLFRPLQQPLSPLATNWPSTFLQVVLLIITVLPSVSGLGTACEAPLGLGHADPDAPYWLETIPKRGISAFNAHPSSYPVFRNVKSYGAVGDGVTDDTDAIDQAIADGERCGVGCDSSTITPAIVYLPRGPLIAYYYTAIVGDAKNPPILLAAPSLPNGAAVIDADPYIPDGWGAQWYQNQNNFFRSVRNVIIDLRQVPARVQAIGLHWQVSQATSLTNIVVEMSQEANNQHQGMFMENGSGGYMGDLVFRGGKYGLMVGNQQFTVRNLTVENAAIGISTIWNWGWTWQRLQIKNCGIGIDISTGGKYDNKQTVGAEIFLDVDVQDTKIFIRTSSSTPTSLDGSIVIDNARLTNVQSAVEEAGGAVVLEGGDRVIAHWIQGNVAEGSGKVRYVQDDLPPIQKPASLLDDDGKIFGRTRPTYADYAADQFISVREHGAKGDGVTDDTEALNQIFEQVRE
ncbi:glycoside hydrolase family 55 protein [Sphaerobolus stellatus SS14]|uniref:Glycoside hydrolase family 55 protein n=1 Tax=Sphaerobolus stellatus (strain SS14) TaxID=990650 RepID=A0A0C9UMK5_SPHS4|nr:glycoside hydrolase family 55 protein [Sphaerobolus stellatus SS14]